MVNRTELVWILSVCVCLCHVCPASPCGGNPMRSLENFARNNGFDSSAQMLHFMRVKTRSDYSSFMNEYRRYLDCMQMVQNGYFKRSTDYVFHNPPENIHSTPNQNKNDNSQLTKRHVNRVEQNIIAEHVDTKTKLNKKEFIKSMIKRMKDTSKKATERIVPSLREEMKAQFKQMLTGKLSNLLKRLSIGLNEKETSMKGLERGSRTSNIYRDLNSRRR